MNRIAGHQRQRRRPHRLERGESAWPDHPAPLHHVGVGALQRVDANGSYTPCCSGDRTHAIRDRGDGVPAISSGNATISGRPARSVLFSPAGARPHGRFTTISAHGSSGRAVTAALRQVRYFWPKVYGGEPPSLIDSKHKLTIPVFCVCISGCNRAGHDPTWVRYDIPTDTQASRQVCHL